MLPAHSSSLHLVNHSVNIPYLPYAETLFIQGQCDWLIFLWFFPLMEPSCSSIYINKLSALVFQHPDSCLNYSYLLHLHPLQNLPHILHGGQAQILHLQFPHLSCCCFLWICRIHVSAAIICELHVTKKSVIYFYTCTVPMMNHVIYSLWNKDVKLTLRKILDSGKCGWIDSMSWCHIRIKCLLRYIMFQFYCSNFWKFRIIFPYNTFPKLPPG